MLHAELSIGCKAVYIKLKPHMISFWLDIVNGKQTNLSKWFYMLLLWEYDSGIYKHKMDPFYNLSSAWICWIKKSMKTQNQ